ncbi:unnamed protein product [Cyprideis torosa]|uniref:Large ribosomal subunit protein uL15m n=1 Tax=Cyprideis torosa TaxID=163714 RepID=A0A7R8ZSH7_9CRUS|nr:unnamed protein product [Cyprideis torosa]CAG0896065.1 unnamed protein product [Cyprideis torosa]
MSRQSARSIDGLLQRMRHLPRIHEMNLTWPRWDNPDEPKYVKRPIRTSNEEKHPSRLGFDGTSSPFYLKVPSDHYYALNAARRGYPPVALRELQLWIDTGMIDPSKPIDLVTLVNTEGPSIDLELRHFGIHLTDEGMDHFKAKVHIEVQYAKEHVIAAVEKNGGSIRTAYYDLASLNAMINTDAFFRSGQPIPRRQLPPDEKTLEYYSDAKNRGYLADPEEIARERGILAQKYGYVLPKIEEKVEEKDPRQVFYGLEPGWVINIAERQILKPKSEEMKAYYRS